MISFLLWYVLITALGWVTFPFVQRLFPALPDRAFSLVRVVSVLLWGYTFWALSSLGALQNNLGGLIFSLIVPIGLGVWAARKTGLAQLRTWLRDNQALVLSVEAMFLVAFAAWAFVRAANPDLFGTEKPMELAFINASLRSPSLPPHDPWLSGHAISYYYFGYILTAMFARLSGLTGGVAFNLAISLVFGLAVTGAYGLVYNLLALRRARRRPASDHEGQTGSRQDRLAALTGPLFVLLLGNVEGLLEILHARGLFWRQNPAGEWVSSFWTWLDIPALTQSPSQPTGWLPRNFGTGFWWWWDASRVIQDYDLAGRWREVIDEFPMFSFILADLHPHVLAIPFAFLGLAIALNLYLGGAQGTWNVAGFRLHLRRRDTIFAALALGGLAFLNTWDFPMYAALVAGAYALARAREGGWNWGRLRDFLGLGLALGVGGVLLYLPFFISFSSQAGGVLPNLAYPTRGAHLWVMFGLFLFPLFSFLLYLYRRSGTPDRLRAGTLAALGLVGALVVLDLLLAGFILALPALESLGLGGPDGLSLTFLRDLYLDSIGASGTEGLLVQAVALRINHIGGLLTLTVLLALTLAALWPRGAAGAEGEAEQTSDTITTSGSTPTDPAPGAPAITPFVLLLILLATLLVLGPEFVYLRDQFGWRINTIFKFYYQAWLMWGVAVAFGAVVMARELRAGIRVAFRAGVVVLVGVGLVYSVLGVWDRAQGFQPPAGFSLDGTRDSHYLDLDEVAAVEWLRQAPYGVIAEAVGGSYSQYARISAHSGNPTVIGWPGHEGQWGREGTDLAVRERDIEQLYRARVWTEVERVLDLYDIRYVFLGSLERGTYGTTDRLFRQHMEPVFQQGSVVIFQARQSD